MVSKSFSFSQISLSLAHSFPNSKTSLSFLEHVGVLLPQILHGSSFCQELTFLGQIQPGSSLHSDVCSNVTSLDSVPSTSLLKWQQLSLTHTYPITLYTISLFFIVHINPRHYIIYFFFVFLPSIELRLLQIRPFLLIH